MDRLSMELGIARNIGQQKRRTRHYLASFIKHSPLESNDMIFSDPTAELAANFLMVSFLAISALQVSSPFLRALLLGSIWVVGIAAFGTFPSVVGEASSLASLVGLFILAWLLHLTELLWVENHVVSNNDLAWRLHAAYKMLFNVRRTALVANPKQTRDDSQKERGVVEQQLHFRQERTQFRNKRLLKAILLTGLFWAYSKAFAAILIPVLSVAMPAWRSGLGTSSYTVQQLLSDLIARIVLVANFVLDTYTLDSIFHSLFALLFVNVLSLDSPEEWPALYGSIADTASVRDFWARFWHKLVQRPLVGLSSYCLRALGIPSRSAAGRVLVPFLVFLFSGIMHGLITWRLGFRCGWWADIIWFCTQFGAIVLEDAVVSRATASRKLTPKVRAMIGYAWTWSLLLYSIPTLQMAKIECGMVAH